MFWFFKETADDKYLRALRDADGDWQINKDLHITSVIFTTETEKFEFLCEDFWVTKNYFEKISGTKRKISKKFFEKIYKIAEEYISHKQIEKVGGYILDEDLRKAISDTKKLMGAHSQIEVLHTQIEKIRSKYR